MSEINSLHDMCFLFARVELFNQNQLEVIFEDRCNVDLRVLEVR